MPLHRNLSILLALPVLACRPALGDPDYPEIGPYIEDDDEGVLPGDDPWDGSSPRLAFSAFYEGGATDRIVIDDETIHYYIYENSYRQEVTSERVEGRVADRITVTSSAFWGGGIHLDTPRDLSAWTTLHVALRSPDAAMESFQLGMVGSAGEGRANITSYGFVADDAWHVLNIPLADLQPTPGFNAVSVGLLLISPVAVPGTTLLIDDLYLTAGGP